LAEPWDLGPYGYHAGGHIFFRRAGPEWNGQYRDNSAGRFWKGGTKVPLVADLRLARWRGSSDIFG